MAKRRLQRCFIEPEHGPAPYQPALPYTSVPVSNVWEINSWVGSTVQSCYKSWVQLHQTANVKFMSTLY
jgi:hypothetical protein